MSAFHRDYDHDIKRLTLRVSKLAAEVHPLLPIMEIIMTKIDDLNAAVAVNKTSIDAAITMLEGLKGQAGTGATDEQLQSVIDQLTTQDASLNAVVSPAPAA